MATIRILSPDVASKIRAGEVVDRPAAVVKELVENAIDAGSRLIAVQVAANPERMIRVQDDGAGMSREDALLSLKRHATSKLASDSDLEAIATLGFRGEALAAIAEVSRLTLSTRSADDLSGTQVEVLGGATLQVQGVGRAVGTTITVEDLFFNTPARLRFLKSRDAESRVLSRVVWSYVLTYPAIHWRFKVEGREDTDLPVATDLLERWQILYGRNAAEGAEAFEHETGGVTVRGVLAAPEQARASRDHQVVAVNGRVITSPAVGAALRQGYGNLIPPDRNPIAVVSIEIDPSMVDVNVHPTKREVRFRDEARLFHAVRSSVENAMRRYVPVSMTDTAAGDAARAEGGPWSPGGASTPRSAGQSAGEGHGGVAVAQAEMDGLEVARALYAPPATGAGPEEIREGDALTLRENLSESEIQIWQLHDRYLLAPIRGGLVIVDQHAAHERILYEEARARLYGDQSLSQHLLFPRVLDVTPDELDRLLLLEPHVRRLGYEVSLFGERQVAIRAVPTSVPEEAAVAALQSLLARDESHHDSAGDPPEEHVAKTFACHAAVRSGQALAPEERRALIDRLFATDLPHGDPHGRSTYVRVSMEELDRRFGRR